MVRTATTVAKTMPARNGGCAIRKIEFFQLGPVRDLNWFGILRTHSRGNLSEIMSHSLPVSVDV